MLRKTTAAVVLAGALALGTASATSLGTFNDITFAASDVDLLGCQVTGDLLELLPDIPTTTDVGTELGATTTTFDLVQIDVTPVTDALLAFEDGVDNPCVTDTVLELVLLDGSDTILDVVQVDPDGTGLNAVPLNTVLDLASVAEVRAVLRDATV